MEVEWLSATLRTKVGPKTLEKGIYRLLTYVELGCRSAKSVEAFADAEDARDYSRRIWGGTCTGSQEETEVLAVEETGEWVWSLWLVGCVEWG